MRLVRGLWRVDRAPQEALPQALLHSRPLRIDNRVACRRPRRVVRRHSMCSQQAFETRAEPFKRFPRALASGNKSRRPELKWPTIVGILQVEEPPPLAGLYSGRRGRKDMALSSEKVDRKDVAIATVVAAVMAATFTYVGGRPLLVTFIPGVIVAWGIVLWLHIRRVELPSGNSLYPLYFGALAWQFIHFTEEFATGFRLGFFPLYGHPAVSSELFVAINMLSYFIFAVAFILAFAFKLRFLLQPVAFFIIYGAIGNAISHVWWVALSGGYFPGFFTALLYWLIGPILLARLLGGARRAAVAIGCFALILLPAMTLGRERPTPPQCEGFRSLVCYKHSMITVAAANRRPTRESGARST